MTNFTDLRISGGRKYIVATLMAGVAPLFFCASVAHADATAGAADASNQVSEIVVSARRVAEPISKTPIAISVATGQDLIDKGVYTFDNIDKIAPNIVIDHGFNGLNITLRGVGTTDPTSRAAPGIATVIDGVQQQNNRTLGMAFFDVDHVEVLRGPQGTLYGANSPGGVINIISNKPENRFAASGMVELGNYNTHRENLMVNLPVNDQLAVRLAGSANDRDGYLLQSVVPGTSPQTSNGAENGEHDAEFRGSVLYHPNDKTHALIQVTAGHSYGANYSSVPYSALISANSGAAQRTAPNNPIPSHVDDKYLAINTELSTEFSGVRATYMGGYAQFDINEILTDGGGFHGFITAIGNPPGPSVGGYLWGSLISTENSQSQEIRFQNANPGKLEWTIGAAYLELLQHQNNENMQAGDPSATDFNATISSSYDAGLTLDHVNRRDYGVFGTLNYHLTDQIRLYLGLRDASDHLTRDGLSAGGGQTQTHSCLFLEVCPGSLPISGEVKSSKLTYRVGLDYQPNKSHMFYADIATGYKPGGYNDPVGGPPGSIPPQFQVPTYYATESLTAYEIGYKGRPIQNLYVDSVAYFDDYTRYQVNAAVSLPAYPGQAQEVQLTVPVKILGWETSANYKLNENHQIYASLNFLSGKYTKLLAGGSGNPTANWNGYYINNAPTTTATIGYKYKQEIARFGSITFNIDSSYTADYYVDDISGAQQYRQAPFTRSNADLTLNPLNSLYFVQIFVKNIEDRVEETSFQGAPFCCGHGNVGITEPRFFGVRFGAKM